MANLSAISSEVFDILRSFDYVLDLYDEDGNAVYEPEDARRFFGSRTSTKTENIMVAVIDENDDSLVRLILGPSSDVMGLEGLRETLRTTATKYNMIYDLETRDQEIQPKDFATRASIREGKELMNLTETKLYGTSRSSYARFENARMIIRHSKRVDEETPGARTRNISKVFVENAEGERYLMPVNNLSAGLAMGQHVNQGGTWADPIAAKIEDMGSYFNDLGSAMGYLGSGEVALAESACEIRGKCKARRKAVRESLRRLANAATYTNEAETYRNEQPTPLLEGSDLEQLRESITVEGRKLPERVLNACARVLAEKPLEEDGILDEEMKMQDVKATGTVKVLGLDIDANVWSLFKERGEIRLRHQPDMADMPVFKSTLAQIMYKMNEVSKVITSNKEYDGDSLANMLSRVYQAYVNDVLDRDPAAKRQATILGIKVCEAAKVKIIAEGGLGPRGVTAILEMEEWFRGFHPDRVLLAETAAPMEFPTFEEGQRVCIQKGCGYDEFAGQCGVVLASSDSHHGTEFANDIEVELDAEPGMAYRFTADCLAPETLAENALDLLAPILKAAGFSRDPETRGGGLWRRGEETIRANGAAWTADIDGERKTGNSSSLLKKLLGMNESTNVNMAHVEDIEDQEPVSEELVDEELTQEDILLAKDDDEEFEIIPGDSKEHDLAKEVLAPGNAFSLDRLSELAGLNRNKL